MKLLTKSDESELPYCIVTDSKNSMASDSIATMTTIHPSPNCRALPRSEGFTSPICEAKKSPQRKPRTPLNVGQARHQGVRSGQILAVRLDTKLRFKRGARLNRRASSLLFVR